MKKLLIVSREQTRWAQSALTLLVGLGLTGAFWFATIPAAVARLMTPTEMIEAGLPPGVVIKTAGKPQFLTAVCAAIKAHRKSAAAITETAVAAHHEYAGDIVATAVRCANGDCQFTGSIVAAAISAWPDSASVIDDAAIAVAPDCADAIQSATSYDGKQVLDGKEVLPPGEGPDNQGAPPSNQTPLLDSIGGGGFNPQEPTVEVCDNGRQRAIRASQLNHYLSTHPGSFVGACVITPATSR